MRHAHPIAAALYDPMLAVAGREFLAALRAASVGAARGFVVEVGAGTGLNFRHYRALEVQEVLAIEPDPHMRRRAARRIAEAAVPIRLVEGVAEALPVPDACADTIVSTLVLCSVERPDLAIAEWRRVLRPGGVVQWMEHVRSSESWRARLQDWVTPVWRRMAAGCRPNRPMLEIFRACGLEVQECERFDVGLPWTKPIVMGTAWVR
jgi:ubiquinone/menaquinone biosynthesis C-methylase UbiE